MYMLTILQLEAYPRDRRADSYLDRDAREMVAYLDKLQQPGGLFFHAPDVPYLLGSRRLAGWPPAWPRCCARSRRTILGAPCHPGRLTAG